MKQIKQTIGEIKSFDTEQYFSPNANIPIDDVIHYLQDCKNKGASYINFNGSGDRDGDVYEVEINPFVFRNETEQEITERENREKEREEYRENNPNERPYLSFLNELIESNKTSPIAQNGMLFYYPSKY